MMYSVDTTARFEKSLRECKRQGKRIDDLWEVVAILMEDGCLPAEFIHYESLEDLKKEIG